MDLRRSIRPVRILYQHMFPGHASTCGSRQGTRTQRKHHSWRSTHLLSILLYCKLWQRLGGNHRGKCNPRRKGFHCNIPRSNIRRSHTLQWKFDETHSGTGENRKMDSCRSTPPVCSSCWHKFLVHLSMHENLLGTEKHHMLSFGHNIHLWNSLLNHNFRWISNGNPSGIGNLHRKDFACSIQHCCTLQIHKHP